MFGEGPLDARLVFVGEQPGDQEDRRGAPFVGPAGRVLDDALERAGLSHIRFHDLRHTAVTRFFDWYNLGIERVALISGHVDWKMLRRYTHLSAEQIADSLAEVGSQSSFGKNGVADDEGGKRKNSRSRGGNRRTRTTLD